MSNPATPTANLSYLADNCQDVLRKTAQDTLRANKIQELLNSVALLDEFVRQYEKIEDPNINNDDEILNWTFTESLTDFSSAIWLISSGFYKAAASSLRNAFEVSTLALYFQIRENRDPATGQYNRFYAKWDRGEIDTPNWGEMETIIAKHTSFKRFCADNNVDLWKFIYSHYQLLCGYTHTRAFDKKGEPITSINTVGVSPAFNADYFDRVCVLTEETISCIAILWKVVYPQIATPHLSGIISNSSSSKIFLPPHGSLALAHQ